MFEYRSARSASALIGRVLVTVLLAALLAGCDRCGDWWKPFKFQSEACRDEMPRPH
jgi:hypothetical protein